MLLLLWLASFFVALPATVVITESIDASVGESRMRVRLLEGFDTGWHGEYLHTARGIERTVSPSQVGLGAWLDNLDEGWSGRLFTRPWGIVATGGLFALLWLFFLGGILERFRRSRPRFFLSDFLGSGGEYFFRFLRLAVFSGALYFLVFKLAWWLFPWIRECTEDVTVERTVLLYNLLGAALIVFLLVLIKLIFDYAKVAMVVEERRSAFWALLRGVRFVFRRPLKTFGLVVGFALLLAVVSALYGLVAPGAGQSTASAIVGAFLVSQLFLAAKLFLKLGLLGSQVALYERETRA
jgi:hypothetical protein